LFWTCGAARIEQRAKQGLYALEDQGAQMPNMFNTTILRAVLATGSVALALSASPAQATDGYFLNGVGAKAKGMGGVAIALPQEPLSIASNPAAATEVGHGVQIDVDVFIPDRGAAISGNGAGLNGSYSGNGANPFLLPEFAYVRPLSDSVSVGLSISGNGGMNTHYKTNPFASFGATGKAGVDLAQVFIAPTVAVKLAKGHSVGVSPIVMVQGFKASGIQPFAMASADPEHFTNKGRSISYDFGLRIGYMGQLAEGVRVGAFYQSKIHGSRFKKYAGLFADQGSFHVPASYGAGISVQPGGGLTLAADVKQIEYSDVGSVGNPIAPLFAGVPFGADGGPGFGWRDVTAVKFGASYAFNETITLRAGYGHSQNPIPSSETFLNILAPGVVQDHFTLGGSVALGSGKELTAFVMRAPNKTVRGSGSIPAPYGGGEADISLAETAIGFGFSWMM
jgi:long-chain fatty acid transport protein